jgi:hypothetical protein
MTAHSFVFYRIGKKTACTPIAFGYSIYNPSQKSNPAAEISPWRQQEKAFYF